MADEDRKQMQILRDQLKKQNAEKLAEMDAQEAELEAAILLQKNELDKLGDLERQLLEKEARRNKEKELEKRGTKAMGDDQLVQKILNEYEKGA